MNQVTDYKNPISEHIFVFPFSWKNSNQLSERLFYPHIALKRKHFEHLRHWQIHYSTIEDDQDYNEFVYFYKPIRSALYTFENQPLIVKNYVFKSLDETQFFKMQVKEQEYVLSIKQIRLKLYKTGIGLLFFELQNPIYKDLEDIEAINSFSKMIYPPLLPLDKAKSECFPEAISIRLNRTTYVEELFKADYYKESLAISPLIMFILGEPFVCKEKKGLSSCIVIEPIFGNQMFCCCIYQNPHFIQGIEQGEIQQECLERFMTLNKKRSYSGSCSYIKNDYSLYGINRFMLLCITKEWVEGKLYNQLVTLILMQRATLLSLSTEIARISTLPKYELAEAISSIYEIYIQFINQLYFKEVTEDGEGARIYEELSRAFKIEEELSQLNFEVDEVHEYATLVEQAASNIKVQLLTIAGAALVLPSFVTGFFGMNIFKEEAGHWWEHRQVTLWLNSYVLLPILVVIILCTWTKRKEIRYLVMKLILIGMLLLSTIITLKCGCGL